MSAKIAIKKSTQCGISEYLIAKSIHWASKSKNILYILPTFSLKTQFVQERVDKTIRYTRLYRDFLNTKDEKGAESTSIKQFGSGTIVFSGSNTPTAFVSFPADKCIVDELDECAQEYIPMLEERQSASTDKSTILVGNPTIKGIGIDKVYNNSDCKEWYVKCSSCGKMIRPDFFKHVVTEKDGAWILLDDKWERSMDRDIYPICDICHKPYDRFNIGEWIGYRESETSGYHVSKMFSTAILIKELAERFSEGLSNEIILQRFYNGDLGLSYISTGAKIDSSMLDDCIDQTYTLPSLCETPCIAGIDVGSVFNIIIAEPLQKRIVYIGELPVQDIAEIKDLFRQYSVRLFVIDALPETRIARQIIAKNKTGFMNYYSLSKNELTISVKDSIISTNRTVCLDAVKEAIILKEFALPANAKTIPGFYEQMTSSTRIYSDDKQTFSWVESGPDHYFHSWAYMLLAKKLLVMAQ